MDDMRRMIELGRAIEEQSFAAIDREAGPHRYSPEQWQVVRRVIHSTADFEFKDLIRFHPQAIGAGIDALRRGSPIVVDARMISAGLNAERLAAFGCTAHCYIGDDDVIAAATTRNRTRASEAMRKAHRAGTLRDAIVAVGNAPTALLELTGLIAQHSAAPALVVGVPVGFVSAVESKEALMRLPTPYIVTQGRKGGSTIAVAIIHALLILSAEAGR